MIEKSDFQLKIKENAPPAQLSCDNCIKVSLPWHVSPHNFAATNNKTKIHGRKNVKTQKAILSIAILMLAAINSFAQVNKNDPLSRVKTSSTRTR